MPWTVEDAKRFKKDLTDAEASLWVRIANDALERCLRQGKRSRQSCESLAIASASAVINRNRERSAAMKFTEKEWDGSKSRFTVEQLLDAVPKAIAAWARKRARELKRDVIKDDLKLPYKEPDGTVNINAVRNALARISQVEGVPRDVLADARAELERVLEEYKRQKESSALSYRAYAGNALSFTVRDNGVLHATIRAVRAGVYKFENPDGSPSYELIPHDELNEDVVKQFAGLPITHEHPAGGMVTPENISEVVVGMTGSDPTLDENGLVAVSAYIFDQETIQAIQSGLDQVSVGFQATVEESKGEWNGERYDKVLRSLKINHIAVALSAGGRCGPACAIKPMAVTARDSDNDVNHKESSMELIIEDVKLALPDDMDAALVQSAQERINALVELKKERETLLARVAGLEEAKKLFEAKCAEVMAKLQELESGKAMSAAFDERLELVNFAQGRIEGYSHAGKSNREIMVDVIKTFKPDFSDEGKSDAEVKAFYMAFRDAMKLFANNEVRVSARDASVSERLAKAKEAIRGISARKEE